MKFNLTRAKKIFGRTAGFLWRRPLFASGVLFLVVILFLALAWWKFIGELSFNSKVEVQETRLDRGKLFEVLQWREERAKRFQDAPGVVYRDLFR